ncbi:YbgA family protein [Desertibacillus haloalkaliphilus]|uniref:YbgA family protein n=1 Tax=Desertibacillus haloalkaliphilus TaxID=1328930 RepID=UPI001C259FB8|nr:DUF523 and DUF1722 domain-containing protein [Desertibacillus haloalkaliphilus]MBU8905818.1 DUF523 and DUF1722 domain-containing protein [Desertibacillus haloalkaliphilus]
MRRFAKPTVVVSKCLEFEACRYNGDKITNATICDLKPYVEFIPVCPEVEIGLSIPRETIRLVDKEGKNHLLQPSTGEDLTESMSEFSEEFLNNVGSVDGFILKSRSPTCGIKDARVYKGIEKGPTIGKANGIFADHVMQQFGGVAIEDEGRLNNFTIRERFFIKLFTLAEFRDVKQSQSIGQLERFHQKNYYLFKAFRSPLLQKLESLIKTYDQQGIFAEYEHYLKPMFQRMARYDSNINVCNEIVERFRTELSSNEYQFYQEMIEKYRQKKIPFSSVQAILKAWAVRFEDQWLLQQTYFEPYPESLLTISDSGKGRDY